ncbi:MAG: hypothetical protein QN183_14275 [Armatimonadota bacterium]|nr:hypothetical protein [Armatimonadota bacterium]MDR7485795.1 hypothetical protein [Armatimonadota bacterium]MDR7532091.1 hypothetical protein [Armatimonadota bacterium]MDR7537513.1 hypothetical protein [Armatimonadota bacterium]
MTLHERLSSWVGGRVSIVYSSDELQVGDLLEVGDGYLTVQVGSIRYVVNLASIVRINQVQ